MDEQRTNYKNDHDLLIQIDTKLERVIQDVRDLSSGLSGDVATLKATKQDRAEAEALATKFDARLTIVERAVWIGIGGLAILQVAFKFFIK